MAVSASNSGSSSYYLGIASTSVYAEDEIKPCTSDGCSSFLDPTLKDKEL
ncbi:hypothetical protein [Colwellia sp. MT41]|nr:hypothetical protein [Colwellia sp. MT41]